MDMTKAEEITNWIVNIGIDEFQTIDKQVQFKRKLEAYHQSRVNSKISELTNKHYNILRNSKGDAECRRYLKEHLDKQLNIHSVVQPKANSCICQEMTKQGVDSWHCRGCNTHWE
jgi:hypothetical protein